MECSLIGEDAAVSRHPWLLHLQKSVSGPSTQTIVTKCHLLGRHGLATRAVFQQSDDPSNSTPCTRSVIHSSLSCTMTTPLDRLRLLPSYCGFCTAVDFAPTDHHHPWILRCCDRGRSVTLWHLIPKKQITATFQSHASILANYPCVPGRLARS